MCQVYSDNFEILLPEICGHIDRSSFIAFDCEFTALRADDSQQNSLFDDIDSRYRKQALASHHSIISQIGISVFEHNLDKNEFVARTYNFWISPRSIGSVDETFVCQASSLEFLKRFNFDFNKFVYHGICYLNRNQEEKLLKVLRNGSLLNCVERNLPLQDEDTIRSICTKLSSWNSRSKIGEDIVIETELIVPYILHKEIRSKFSNLWTFSRKDDASIQVKKVNAEEREQFELAEDETALADEIIGQFAGFSKLMKYISRSKKPLVGHNCLLDLIKIWRQFFSDLPKEYSQFKQLLHEAFPIIYDTKNICFKTKRRISKIHPELEHVFASSNLNDLHQILTSRDDKYNRMWSPRIVHAEGFSDYQSSRPHEAGYDAFIAGFCFIRTCHLAATISYLDIRRMRVMTFHEMLNVVAEYENHVNVARAVTHFTNLAGKEVDSVRPPYLYICSRASSPLDFSLIASTFSRFACSDIRPLNSCEAVVAVSSYRGARDLLSKFSRDPRWKLEIFSSLKHSPITRKFLKVGIMLGSFSLAFILLKNRTS